MKKKIKTIIVKNAIDNSDDTILTHHFDINGNHTKTVGYDFTTINQYDDNNNCVYTEVIENETGAIISKYYYAYDNNNIVESRIVRPEEKSPHVTTYEYDENNNCILEADSYNTINYTYDEHNRLVEKSQTCGIKEKYFYNDDGILIRDEHYHNGELLRECSFTYDDNCNLICRDNGRIKMQYQYNDNNDIVVVTHIKNNNAITYKEVREYEYYEDSEQ